METITLKTNMHCESCINTMKLALKSINNIAEISFNMNHPEKLAIISGNDLDRIGILSAFTKAGYSAKEYIGPAFEFEEYKIPKSLFWKNLTNWKRASFNTLNCLIGCSLGDFGMIIFLQAYYPDTSMLWQMILAIIAGLSTSVALESSILRVREQFDWALAFKTALSMSFISMIGMEIAMNTTDFMITGGKASFNTYMYWLALIPAMIAGFLLPLPYNYYKLQKFNKSCH